MRSRTMQIGKLALAAGLAGALGASAGGALAAGEGVVAQVVSAHGNAWAERADGAKRPLACGDVVHEGERVVTSAAGRVGLLSGDVYTQLEHSSQLLAGLTSEGAPDWTLERGKVRVTDEREAASTAPRHRLATPHAETLAAGNDSEAYVFAEKVGQYSMLCEWEKPLEVTRPGGAERKLAKTGECVIAKPSEPLYTAPAHPERIALAGDDACDVGTLIGDAGNRFTPTDVAAGPPGGGLGPPAPPAFLLPPCAEPGSGCAGVLGLGVVESPATDGIGDIPGLGGGKIDKK